LFLFSFLVYFCRPQTLRRGTVFLAARRVAPSGCADVFVQLYPDTYRQQAANSGNGSTVGVRADSDVDDEVAMADTPPRGWVFETKQKVVVLKRISMNDYHQYLALANVRHIRAAERLKADTKTPTNEEGSESPHASLEQSNSVSVLSDLNTDIYREPSLK